MESEGNGTIQTLGYADASSSSTTGYYPNMFDGTPQETTNFGAVYIICQADASGILRAMHSMDNSTWDFTDTIEYPGTSASIGDTINVRKDIKAKWYKTQFEHQDTSVGAECNVRLQTLFQPAVTAAEPNIPENTDGHQHAILVDPNAAYTAWGTGNPMPVETVAGSTTKTIGSDSTLNVLGGSVSAPSTYTSNSERSYEPDVGVMFKSDQDGMLYFQFSPDNSNWSDYASTNFPIAQDVWSFNTAVKLPQYFRWAYTPSGGTANFDCYTYFGTFRQRNGQATMDRSAPVVLASDHSRVNVDATLQIADSDIAYGAAPSGSSLPVVLANDHANINVAVQDIPNIGFEGNLWSAASPSGGGNSTSIDCNFVKTVDIFGQNTTGVGNLEIHVSQDDATFYDTGHRIVVASGTPFYGSFTIGARYVRVQTDVSQTGLTATLAGKQ